MPYIIAKTPNALSKKFLYLASSGTGVSKSELSSFCAGKIAAAARADSALIAVSEVTTQGSSGRGGKTAVVFGGLPGMPTRAFRQKATERLNALLDEIKQQPIPPGSEEEAGKSVAILDTRLDSVLERDIAPLIQYTLKAKPSRAIWAIPAALILGVIGFFAFHKSDPQIQKATSGVITPAGNQTQGQVKEKPETIAGNTLQAVAHALKNRVEFDDLKSELLALAPPGTGGGKPVPDNDALAADSAVQGWLKQVPSDGNLAGVTKTGNFNEYAIIEKITDIYNQPVATPPTLGKWFGKAASPKEAQEDRQAIVLMRNAVVTLASLLPQHNTSNEYLESLARLNLSDKAKMLALSIATAGDKLTKLPTRYMYNGLLTSGINASDLSPFFCEEDETCAAIIDERLVSQLADNSLSPLDELNQKLDQEYRSDDKYQKEYLARGRAYGQIANFIAAIRKPNPTQSVN